VYLIFRKSNQYPKISMKCVYLTSYLFRQTVLTLVFNKRKKPVKFLHKFILFLN